MEICASAVREGISFCLENLVPSLFPFFVLSALLIQSGMIEELSRPLGRLMPALFGVSENGASAVLLGSISGYGVGVTSIRALYEKGTISREDAEHLLAFCTNAGPAFCLGLCARVLGGIRAALLLYGLELISAFLCGLLLRGGKPRQTQRQEKKRVQNPLKLIPAAVQSAVRAMGNICGFVLWFFLLLRLFQSFLSSVGFAPQGLFYSLFLGFFEVTGGIFSLAATRGGFILAAALVAWGGVCVHLQTISLLEGSGLSAKYYLRGKALQTALAALLAWGASHLL